MKKWRRGLNLCFALLALLFGIPSSEGQAKPLEQSAPAEYKLGESYTLIVDTYQDRSLLPDTICMRIVKNDNIALALALNCQTAGRVTVQQDTGFTNQFHSAWIVKVYKIVLSKTCVILLPKSQEATTLISCF